MVTLCNINSNIKKVFPNNNFLSFKVTFSPVTRVNVLENTTYGVVLETFQAINILEPKHCKTYYFENHILLESLFHWKILKTIYFFACRSLQNICSAKLVRLAKHAIFLDFHWNGRFYIIWFRKQLVLQYVDCRTLMISRVSK